MHQVIPGWDATTGLVRRAVSGYLQARCVRALPPLRGADSRVVRRLRKDPR